jgi:hypothetical protein
MTKEEIIERTLVSAKLGEYGKTDKLTEIIGKASAVDRGLWIRAFDLCLGKIRQDAWIRANRLRELADKTNVYPEGGEG